MQVYAKWISITFILVGLSFSICSLFEIDVGFLRVREDTAPRLLRFGLLFIAFGLAIMLTHVFGEKHTFKIQGIIFTGSLAVAAGVLFLAEEYVHDTGQFSHPNLDLVVVCRISPEFLDGEKMSAMVRLNTNKGKIQRIVERSKVLAAEKYASTFNHLSPISEQQAYITPTRDNRGDYRFEIKDLLPVSSSDNIDILLTSASQTLAPVEYVIFSSYIATGNPRTLIAEINLQDAGEVCNG